MSNYNLVFLDKENVLNKILKYHKKAKDPFAVLFISLWDERCQALISILKKKFKSSATDENLSTPLYIVDSFNMPHSFVIFKTKQVPFLVLSKETKRGTELEMEGYLPRLLDHFSISRFILG